MGASPPPAYKALPTIRKSTAENSRTAQDCEAGLKKTFGRGPRARCHGELYSRRRFDPPGARRSSAGDAEVVGRALESCRDYLLMVAAQGSMRT